MIHKEYIKVQWSNIQEVNAVFFILCKKKKLFRLEIKKTNQPQRWVYIQMNWRPPQTHNLHIINGELFKQRWT